MAAFQAFAGPLYGESAIWKSCAGCAPTEAAKRPSGVVVASGAERTRNPKAEDCRLDGGPLVKWHARRSCRGGPLPIVAAVSGRCHPHPRSGVGRAPRGFRRDPAGIDCLRGTTENWSGTSFDTNKRSCAFAYDHARRAVFDRRRDSSRFSSHARERERFKSFDAAERSKCGPSDRR
jgi:hypothetical protein